MRKLMVSLLIMTLLMTELVMAESITENIKVGDIITFGAYEQDNNEVNGAEPIEWEVLEITDGKALLLSCFALDSQPYNNEVQKITWEHCALRYWLNQEFFNTAFTESEQAEIVEAELANNDNPIYGTNGGKETKDKVYLLSLDEIEKYYGVQMDNRVQPNDSLICRLTPYGREQYIADYAVYLDLTVDEAKEWYEGVEEYNGQNACWWWLRSPGADSRRAAGILHDGSIYGSGGGSSHDYAGVRPAIWIEMIAFYVKME